jgi:hypothetical protein
VIVLVNQVLYWIAFGGLDRLELWLLIVLGGANYIVFFIALVENVASF